MKKIIFGIFAHPDDEAFGPCGTLLLETRAGAELHLITLTAGENGMNPDNHENLGDVRLNEWRTAGKLMGATTMHHLGFIDGTLGNINHIEASEKIEALVRTVIAEQSDDVEVEFMTNDLNGITGHIDHIVAARSACFVFYKLKDRGLPLTRIRLATVPQSLLATHNLDFVYMEAGRPDSEIDEVIDAREIVTDIYEIMRAHHTQRSDGEGHISRHGENVAMNYFIVKT